MSEYYDKKFNDRVLERLNRNKKINLLELQGLSFGIMFFIAFIVSVW